MLGEAMAVFIWTSARQRHRPSLLGILGNVLSGAYVFDITKTDAKLGQYLDWHATPHSPAFWGLVAVAVVTGFCAWGIARAETRASRPLTDDDIRTKALEVLFEPLLNVMQQGIKDGKLGPSKELLTMLGIERKPE